MTSCKINHSPQWLQTQTRIQDLDLSNTGISGKPHEWFINTTSLLRLNLSNNFLTGPLQKQLSLGQWDVDGSFIDLSSNQFSGPILLSFGKDYCGISSLQLNNNSLTGHIPSSLWNCTQLQILDLSRNKLSGLIPPWTSDQLLNLYVLRLQENQLGEVNSKEDSTILKNLCKLRDLNILDLQNNRLSGTIPNCWESSTLQVINLSSNNLSGVIPCSLGNISSLEYLHLSDNKLGGHIPSRLSNLTQLRLLNLGGNELAGAIPKWFDTSFSSLEVLRLPRNKFRGSVPKEL
ncbi:LRR receptor-like serine/threonine-protein kinase ERECTA [Chenopodium quinoa]|nr:LRR receptor-like serine/threonine-protein kinase ERECTA [Chenopodium quinoa]